MSSTKHIFILINIRFFMYTNSHEHKQFFFRHSQHIKWAKHIISPNVGFFTFWLVLTVMYVFHLTEERRVWPLLLSLPGLGWGLENKRTVHWWTLKHGIPGSGTVYCSLPTQCDMYTSVLCPSFTVLQFCVRNIRTALHGFCCQFWQWYIHLLFPSSSVTEQSNWFTSYSM